MPSILVKYSGVGVELANCHGASGEVQSSDVVQEGRPQWMDIGNGEMMASAELVVVLRR